MPSPIVFLIVEDSDQDYQDVCQYVYTGWLIKDWANERDYVIDRARIRGEAEEELKRHQKGTDPLIAIFDVHIEKEHDDLTEVFAAIVQAPLDTWLGKRPVIVYSQYAERVNLSGKMVNEKKKRGLFFLISKSLRSSVDPRESLREAISSALDHIQSSGEGK